MRSKLDESALFHCAMANDHFINVFRITFTLKDTVDENNLQEVVNQIIHKYPTICCRIYKDFFNYYVESLDSIQVQEDKQLLSTINNRSMYENAIAIFYKNKTISLELFHGVSDGHGTFVFVHDLISQYIYKKYHLENTFDTTIESHIEDAFIETPTKEYKKHKSVNLSKPYQFEKRNNNIKVTTLKINVQEIKEISKKYSCTINELLLSIFYRSILNERNKDKNVFIAVPINLRRLFQTNTLKNFTLLATLCMKYQENRTIEQFIQEIRNQMNLQNNKEYLGYEIEKVKLLNKLIKYFPVLLKDIAIHIGSYFRGNKTCMTITNLGNITFMDQQVQSYIESIDAVLCPRANSPYNCGISTINNTMHINITHDDKNDELIHQLEKELNKLNIQYHKHDYQERVND